MKICTTEWEGHSEGSPVAPANVIKWLCAVTGKSLVQFLKSTSPGANAQATGTVRFLPPVAKLTILNSYFSVSAYEFYPDISWVTDNLHMQLFNESDVSTLKWNIVCFCCYILMQNNKLWACYTTTYCVPSVFLFHISINCDQSGVFMLSSLNWDPKMLIQHHHLPPFCFFFFNHFYIKKSCFQQLQVLQVLQLCSTVLCNFA